MKRTFFALLAASAFVAGSAAAAEMQTSRSVGAHPVVQDDYPEADLVLDAGNGILLSITGELRHRFEWVENNQDFSGNGTSDSSDDDYFDDEYFFAPARANLGFRVDLPRDVAAVVEIQSGWDWGDEDGWYTRHELNEAMRPGHHPSWENSSGLDQGYYYYSGELDYARDDRKEYNNDGVYIYQAYIEAANIGDSIFSLRVGRQELAYGTEMLLGNRDFYDGISYDAIKGIFEFSDNSRLDLFYAKINEEQLDGDHDEEDNNFYGAYFSTQSLGGSRVGLDAYGLYWNDNESDLDSAWLGIRFFREALHGWHFSTELAYQFGDIGSTDIEAWAFEGFAGYTWDRPTNPGIHFGVTFATGQDFDDSDAQTFWTPSGEVHPRLGLADFVSLSNIVAYNLGYTGSKEDHSWGVDLFHFDLEEDNNGPDELGQEVDLWYNYQYSKNLVAQFAIAYVNAGNVIEEANKAFDINTSDAWRIYANLLLRF